jgi:hypothetical protein
VQPLGRDYLQLSQVLENQADKSVDTVDQPGLGISGRVQHTPSFARFQLFPSPLFYHVVDVVIVHGASLPEMKFSNTPDHSSVN